MFCYNALVHLPKVNRVPVGVFEVGKRTRWVRYDWTTKANPLRLQPFDDFYASAEIRRLRPRGHFVAGGRRYRKTIAAPLPRRR